MLARPEPGRAHIGVRHILIRPCSHMMESAAADTRASPNPTSAARCRADGEGTPRSDMHDSSERDQPAQGWERCPEKDIKGERLMKELTTAEQEEDQTEMTETAQRQFLRR